MSQYHSCHKKESKWLIMVYLAGDNNLSAQTIAFLQELEAAEHDSNVRVVAGFDSASPLPKGARYLEIKRHRYEGGRHKTFHWPLHNDLMYPGHVVTYPDFCETLKGGAKPPDEPVAEESLARFFDWVRKHYVADRYMLILFGHGTLVAGNTFLSDTNPPSYLKLRTFSRILNGHFGERLDILACDNCVMNGIETAVELWGQVDYMVGSQGLMLANGWPFREIIEAVGHNWDCETKEITVHVLRVCARKLLDFSLMERSSEQAICDITKFGKDDRFVSAVRELSCLLQRALQFKRGTKHQELLYPAVSDAIRLARLEAQAYWSETFVDLYDFVLLLLKKCNDFKHLLAGLTNAVPEVCGFDDKKTLNQLMKPWPLYRVFVAIAEQCEKVLHIFRDEEIVPRAYYVCPQLQYSHGVSVYFPWTLPEGPITFEPVRGSGWNPKNYYLKTPFQEYETYRFAQAEYGDWGCFLKAFFRATLRNVRVVEYDLIASKESIFFKLSEQWAPELATPSIDLQKSSSDTGEEDECDCPRIKNYPRRFYLSPADCWRRIPVPGLEVESTDAGASYPPHYVSYLGWNIRGLLKEIIGIDPTTEMQKYDGCDCGPSVKTSGQ